ncbi:unnamed protein product [Paramecium pentaurelia]|uniref:Attractin/MKLN-like beta-propeller domain-containing protein n=1 Tax=Paramecium pentaurelia TaxID=43138 RepID=A0A8S1VW74_9CILI|nr:unnamed protein product [Paramecium pentaurelia]
MNAVNLNLERDNYKDLLKSIKDQSMQLAIRHQSNSQYVMEKKRKLKMESEHTGKLTLPSIENSTLEDISSHFHSIRRSQPGEFVELIANKSQQKFIQQSFLELQRNKMSQTFRDISLSKKKFKSLQRKVLQQEPNSIKYLEKQLGITKETEKQTLPIIQRLQQKKRKPIEEEIEEEQPTVSFFEETLKSYSYAVPRRRESAQIGIIRDRMYVFGGMSGGGITNEIWWFDLKKQEWNNYCSNVQLFITSHSMIVWKQFLVLFGGSGYYDHKMKIRQVYSTIGLFNTITNQWTTSLESVEPRREHKASVLFGKLMVITGGLDAAEKLLNDTQIYSLESKRWTGQKLLFEEGIAQHAQCTVYDSRRNIETVYIFGGQTATLNSFPLMKMVFYGLHPVGWEKVQYSGQAPEGRYNHTMENIGDYIILIGGRSQEKMEYQNEIFIFNLQNNFWIIAQRQGLQTKRWSHSSCVYGSNILCFGGIGENTYLPPHIYQIETDSYKIRGKIGIIKPLAIINEEIFNNSPPPMITNRDQEQDSKKICRLEKFRKARKMYEQIITYLPLPKLKAPKMRYDILIHFVKIVMKQIGYI